MSSFKIFTDTCADRIEELEEKDIGIVPLYISFDGETYKKQHYEVTTEEFYKEILDTSKPIPKTSLPSAQDYIDAFSPHLDKGTDILYLAVSTGLSGTYQSAVSAKKILEEKYPDRIIEVLDSHSCTSTLSSIVLRAKELQDEGMSVSDLARHLEKSSKDSLIVFAVDSLKYLQKGGRIGMASALLGEILHIKAVIDFSNDTVSAAGKARGKNKAMSLVIDAFKKKFPKNPADYIFNVVYSGTIEEMKAFKEEVMKVFNFKELKECFVGMCIGVHVGPNAIGLSYVHK